MKFYLVHNTEYDSEHFEKKKAEAETLCRIIMQLKGIRGDVSSSSSSSTEAKENRTIRSAPIAYPSPQELQQILDQSHYGIFGDVYQECSHSIQTQQDFGTHVPAPVTTTVVTSVGMRPTKTSKSDNE